MPNMKFETLVDDFGPAVLNTAVRILRDRQKAQDVYQEVFMEIWRRWQKYDGKTKWQAYLYRVTVRKALKLARQPDAKTLSISYLETEVPVLNPQADTGAEELHNKILTCLKKLPQRQADVFTFSKIEGLKHREIADILGCSQQTIRTHLHRATKKIAKELKSYLE